MKDSDGTQIVVMIQPQGESEASELLDRLRTIVNLDPATANGELSELLCDEGVRRVAWATCEIDAVDEHPNTYEIVAAAIEKLRAMRPFTGGRLKAMFLLDDAGANDADADADDDMISPRADASAALN